MSFALVRYVIKAAIRDKLILSMIVLMVVGSSLSVFMGSSAIVEQDQFVSVFAGGGLRLVGVLGLVLFVCFYIRRSFETKDVELLLSRPIGRVQFMLSYSAALLFLAIIVGAAQGLSLFFLDVMPFTEGHYLWTLSIIFENIIMVNTAMFFAMYLSSAATASLATLGFYVLARMMGQILGILDSGIADDMEIMALAMQMISAVMPRLDLLGQTSWLIYGVGDSIQAGFVIVQGVVFTILVLLGALLDLVRKQF